MWIERNGHGVPYYGPTQEAPVIFQNAVDGDGPCLPGVWHAVTVPGIPDDCISVGLCGILIITSGEVPAGQPDITEIADMHLRLRRWLGAGNTYTPSYAWQCVEARAGGQRSPFYAEVALDERRFEWHWTRATPPPYPQHASYGVVAWPVCYNR